MPITLTFEFFYLITTDLETANCHQNKVIFKLFFSFLILVAVVTLLSSNQ